MKCKKGFEIQACRSAAGWYLGTLDENGCPNCRIATEYVRTEKEVETLVPDRQTGCIENDWCNGGTGCGLEWG